VLRVLAVLLLTVLQAEVSTPRGSSYRVHRHTLALKLGDPVALFRARAGGLCADGKEAGQG
jgi:hypothetical protein